MLQNNPKQNNMTINFYFGLKIISVLKKCEFSGYFFFMFKALQG